jgi:hypothetical protein
MAITQISQVQVRRGLEQDLPQLASAELAWSIDTRKLYIGNGTLAEGAPTLGHTEILTQYSNLSALINPYTTLSLNTGTNTITSLATNTSGYIQYAIADSANGNRTGKITYTVFNGNATFVDNSVSSTTYNGNLAIYPANAVVYCTLTSAAILRYSIQTII